MPYYAILMSLCKLLSYSERHLFFNVVVQSWLLKREVKGKANRREMRIRMVVILQLRNEGVVVAEWAVAEGIIFYKWKKTQCTVDEEQEAS